MGSKIDSIRHIPDIVLFLGIFAISMQGPIIQQYLYSWYSEEVGLIYDYRNADSTCDSNVRNKTIQEREKKVQENTASLITKITFFESIPGAITIIYYGALSDKIGRKPVFSFVAAFFVVDSAINLIVIIFKLPVEFFLISGLATGIVGNYNGFSVIAVLYVVDITAAEKLSTRMAVLRGIVSFGVMSSQYVAGPLINLTGFMFPEICVLVITVIVFLWALLVIKESINYHSNHTNEENSNRKNISKALKDIYKQPYITWKIITKKRKNRTQFYLAIMVIAFDYCFTTGMIKTKSLYFLNSPFCWPPISLGNYIGTYLLTGGIATIVGVKIGLKVLSESALCILSDILLSAAFVLLAYTKSNGIAYAGMILSCWRIIPAPVFRAIISKLLDKSETGAVFALISSFQAVLLFISIFLNNTLYAKFVKAGKARLYWYVPAACMIVPLLFTCIYWYQVVKDQKNSSQGLEFNADQSGGMVINNPVITDQNMSENDSNSKIE